MTTFMLSERKDLASQPIWCFSCISSSNSQSSPDSEAVSVSDVGSDTSCKPYSNQHSQLLFWGHRARDFRSIPWGLNGASPRAGIYDYKLFCASAELQNLTILWSFFKDLQLPDGTVVKNPPANAVDVNSIPGLGKVPGGGNGNPLQYS